MTSKFQVLEDDAEYMDDKRLDFLDLCNKHGLGKMKEILEAGQNEAQNIDLHLRMILLRGKVESLLRMHGRLPN